MLFPGCLLMMFGLYYGNGKLVLMGAIFSTLALAEAWLKPRDG